MASLLGFREKAQLLKAARGRATNSRGVVDVNDGLGVSVGLIITPTETQAIKGSRSLQAMLNKVLKNAGNRAIRKTRSHIRSVGAVRTRLFISAWAQVRYDDDRAGFNTAVALINGAPYAKYVHPKGTAKNRTIVNYYVRGKVVPEMAVEITEDLARLRGKIGEVAKDLLLADATLVRGLFEEAAGDIQARFAP